MSITAKFGDKTVQVGAVLRSKEILRGAEREIILILIRTADITYDELYSIIQDHQSLGSITTTNTPDDGQAETPVSTVTFRNYIVQGEPVISLSNEVVDQANGGQPEEVFVLKLGQLSYIEEQLQKMGINPLG